MAIDDLVEMEEALNANNHKYGAPEPLPDIFIPLPNIFSHPDNYFVSAIPALYVILPKPGKYGGYQNVAEVASQVGGGEISDWIGTALGLLGFYNGTAHINEAAHVGNIAQRHKTAFHENMHKADPLKTDDRFRWSAGEYLIDTLEEWVMSAHRPGPYDKVQVYMN